MEVIFELLSALVVASLTPLRHLTKREYRMKVGLSWSTRTAAVGALLATLPLLVSCFLAARSLILVSSDDLLWVLGIFIFLPAAIVVIAIGIASFGASVLAAVLLLEGDRGGRWAVYCASLAGILFGPALAWFGRPGLGYLLSTAWAAEAVLLLLPSTATDFTPDRVR